MLFDDPIPRRFKYVVPVILLVCLTLTLILLVYISKLEMTEYEKMNLMFNGTILLVFVMSAIFVIYRIELVKPNKCRMI